MPKVALLLFVTLLASWPVAHGPLDRRVLDSQPYRPFRIIGNIYYVGVSGVSSFLIATPAGAILLDGGFRDSAPQIAANIEQLGFRLSDVKFLLNSHVHFDHAGGLAELKRRTGAQMVASRADGRWLQIGGRDVSPVVVDRWVDDGDSLQLGEVTMIARVTPGHTPGCTTWTTTAIEGGHPYRVVIYCSTASVDTGRLVGKPRYPTVIADYERSFKVLRDLPCDVFLHVHPDEFDMTAKQLRMKPGAPNPFVDADALRRHVDASEQEFRSEVARQQAELAKYTDR